jgi:putative heme-binding domain-containing protein
MTRQTSRLFVVFCLFVGLTRTVAGQDASKRGEGLFARDNLIAWCIVPFDSKKRGPEERAAMLARLGFKHFAYDWRSEHIPTFDAEVDALKKHGVSLDAFWVAPGELNRESKLILDVLKRHKVRADLWVLLDLGVDRGVGAEQERRVSAATAKLKPLAEAAKAIGCRVALYNHGGWSGEPENQLAIIERLKSLGVDNVGAVYNLHHGHEYLGRLADVIAKLKPHLWAINLNGMDPLTSPGRKILPIGQGERDLEVLRIIRDSGYRGPIGILGHTDDDAELRLRDNLEGLDWLVPQLDGKNPGPRPMPRTPVPGGLRRSAGQPYDRERVTRLVDAAKASGDPRRGAEVFASSRFGCLTCHKVGQSGGAVGPDLSMIGMQAKPEQIVESVLWPSLDVRPNFQATAIETKDGRVLQGYKEREDANELILRDTATGKVVRIKRSDVEVERLTGTLMPEGLCEALTPEQSNDLFRFLFDLGQPGGHGAAAMASHSMTPATFAFDRKPLHPENWPNWQAPVNRDRVYDYYAKEAEYFRTQPHVPSILPQFPGLDGGSYGHWGNQNEKVWTDNRWNESDLGNILSGVFRGAGITVPKAVCVRLGDRGELAACFNPETLCYEAVWQGGFVGFSSVRHGFMDGLILRGAPLPRPEGKKPTEPFVYHGFYRHGNRVVFAYRLGNVEMLDAPWVEGGKFTRVVGPAATHPLALLTKGGPARWPQVLETKGKLGSGRPYVVDTIELPFKNPWKALLFFGDHDFLPDGTAFVCTMEGDVWRVDGLDDSLEHVKWRRVASGLHQAQGLVVADGKVHVLGRDQITRLHDLDGDGEFDYYECVSNAYTTSTAGHDFTCGLQRDSAGYFYTASGKQGVLKISPDGQNVQVLATGFRNPDGLGLTPQGMITVPSSEGDWVGASSVSVIRPGGHYGYMGPKDGRPPDLPLVYLPRGLDNSSAVQVYVDSDRWGPLKGQMIHISHGAGTDFLLLRDEVDGQPQGAVVPLEHEFLAGSHRARFNPKDGQLYVSGMSGWGTYTPEDGSFQRVRYTGTRVQLPIAFHVYENGVTLTFSSPVDRATVETAGNHFAQVWNYRYSSAYGSPELSTRHIGTPGHDPLLIRSVHLLADGQTVFFELPDLQPVNQLHLHVKVDAALTQDVFATIHRLGVPFKNFPGYRPEPKTIAAHPMLADLAMATKSVPNPWRRSIPNARTVTIEAGKNLTFATTSFKVRAGEPIKLSFVNPDVVPHNWALVKPGTLAKVGDLANKIVADPEAAVRHYIPRSDDVLVYTDVVPPSDQFTITFRAPSEPGRYPYLCTFPGHWMVMNGVMIVEPK